MSTAIQRRRGTTAQHASFAGLNGELTVDTDKKTVVVHDGATAGGFPLARQDFSNVNSLALPAGAAATPVYSFTGDTNTGIYSPGADQVAISTGGSGRLFVDASGRVGVGTASPAYAVSVFGAASNFLQFSAAGDSVAGSLIGRTSSTDLRIQNSENAATVFWTNNTERLRITSTGDLNFKGAGTAGSTQAVFFNGIAPVNSLVIDASGRLGAGTSSPSDKLSLEVGAANAGVSVYYSGTEVASLRNDAGNATLNANNAALKFATGGTERLRITSAGLVGIGSSTPGSYDAFADDLVIANGSGNPGITLAGSTTGWGSIYFADGTTGSEPYRGYIQYGHTNDRMTFATAGSGAMHIDSSQRVGIGTATVTDKLTLAHSDATGITFKATGTDGVTSAKITFEDATSGTGGVLTFDHNDNSFKFATAGTTERLRIDSSGRLLVGTSTARSNFFNTSFATTVQIETATSSNRGLSIINNSSADTGAVLILGQSRGDSIGSNTALTSGREIGQIDFQGNDGADFVAAARIEAYVDGTPGADDMPGRLVFSTTADGASSPTERMRISNSGAVGIGTSTATSDSYINVITAGANVAYFNRLNSDGSIIAFRQDSADEGSISVSGNTVTLNGAHLSRWSQLPSVDNHDKSVRPEILRGTVMSNLDQMCEWIDPISGDAQANPQLNKTKISDVEGDKNVAGVFQSWDDDDDTWVNDYYLAMTGDFVIRIAAGVTVERGDLLMSAGDGTAKPQDDDIIRSKTIAKVTSTNVSCTYDDGSYCVPCVLMAC